MPFKAWSGERITCRVQDKRVEYYFLLRVSHGRVMALEKYHEQLSFHSLVTTDDPLPNTKVFLSQIVVQVDKDYGCNDILLSFDKKLYNSLGYRVLLHNFLPN